MLNSTRNNKAQTIAEVIQTLIQENKWNKGLHNVRLQEVWQEQMGQGIMHYTHKITLKGSILLVELTSSVLREELSYGKETIIKNLNSALGEEIIEKIKLL